MPPFRLMVILFAVIALAGLAYVLRWEGRHFRSRGLGSSWLKVRLSSIPAALLVAVLVVVPARSTTGMEGLAVFYLLLIAVAPPIWFGVHWAVGRLARPPLLFADSARIAALPLVYGLVLAALAASLQSLGWSLASALGVH